MTLTNQANAIKTREDLAQFILAMAHDLDEHPSEWEHEDLPSYLVALGAWLEDQDGFFLNRGQAVPEQPSWTLVGQMHLAACVYE